MKIPDHTFIGTWIVQPDGQLRFSNKAEADLFDKLLKGMKKGSRLPVMVDFTNNDGRLSQIAKVKACIRALSKETGDTFINMQNIIKKEAGLYNEVNQEYISFGNASSEQLSSAIHCCVEKGMFLGLNLR